jgi:uncharacterized protein YdaU (DUF1376 family)
VHYYAFNVADYRKDAGWLTVTESGIYRWLIDQYFLEEEPIADDMRLLMRKMHLTSDQEEILLSVLNEFFILINNAWHHPRIDNQLADLGVLIEKKRLAGIASGKARRRTGVEQVLNTIPPCVELPNTQHPIPNTQVKHIRETENSSTQSENKSPPFKTIVDNWNDIAKKNNLPCVVKVTTKLRGQIRQRWVDIPAIEKWDNFYKAVMKSDFLSGRVEAGYNRSKPFRATLLWITNETNFAKIAAGEFN